MPTTLIPVCSQPLQGPLHFKLHVLRREGVTSHGQAPNGLGGHLHDDRVIGREEVPQVVGKSANAGGIASLDTNEACWERKCSSEFMHLVFTEFSQRLHLLHFTVHSPCICMDCRSQNFCCKKWANFSDDTKEALCGFCFNRLNTTGNIYSEICIRPREIGKQERNSFSGSQ